MADETGATTLNLFSQQFDLYSLLQKAASVNNTPLSPKNQDLINNDNNNLFSSSPISQIKGTSPVSSPVNSNANTSASSNSNDSAPSLLSIVKTETRKPLTDEEIRKERAKFTPITPIYVPTGHGRQVLIYDSKSHPGHRREFSYKTQFTNQAGCTTVYYRCLGCRTLRRHLQNMLPAESLPAVPCIAVKNGVLINNPDFPEAADHFCQPPTISQSDERFRTGKRRNTMRNRLKKSTLEQHINLAQFNTNLPEGVDEKTKIREILKNLSTNLYQSPVQSTTTPITESNGIGENNHDNKEDTKHDESTNGTLNNSSSLMTNSSILDDSGNSTFNFNLFESLTKQANQQAVSNFNQSFLASMFGNTTTTPSFVQNNKKESVKNNKTSKLDSLLEMVEMKHNNESTASLKDESTDEEVSSEKKDTPTSNDSLWDSILSKNGNAMRVDSECNKLPVNFNVKNFVVEILLRYVKNNYEVPEDEQTTRKMADFICSLLLSLSNNLYFTINNIKSRSWNNIETTQEGLHGKVLALVGLGRCTSELVTRMKAFGMRIIGFDPNGITVEEHIKKLITIMSLNDILSMADYIVINVPLTASTLNMFTKDIFFKCKKYCKIVNASPRGIINEGALQHVLEKTSIIERIAIQIEPADCTIPDKIMRSEKVICVSNPFIKSDRLNATSSLVESVSSLNNGTGFFDKMTNINGLVLDEIKESYIKSAIQLSQIVQALKPNGKEILIKYPQMLLSLQNAFRAGGVVGIMKSMEMVGQNLAITEALANNMGIKVKVLAHSSLEFAVISGTTSVTGYTSPGGTVITTINGHKLPVTIFASGSLAITLENTEPFGENNGLVYGEYSLIGGGGKILILGDITPEQKKLIEDKLTVVQF
uniref:D-3-phosphoglycerate dehydrogenase (inferred by orthology to a human protein) n=1 Tax=Strongyloides venezuelensis TaxID=75913 RepID=A0A0K0FVI2_STRVS